MKPSNRTVRNMLKVVGTIIGLAIAVGLVSKVREINHRSKFISVPITGIHHMGPAFNVSEFYVNGYYSSNVGREGGGGAAMCCISLPITWRPGLTAEVRWQVGDWSQENRSEIERGNSDSVRWKNYIAQVPVEKYRQAGILWVHFFSDGRVRVVSSELPPENPMHPVVDGDPGAVQMATAGRLISSLYTQAELEKLEHDRPERSGWK